MFGGRHASGILLITVFCCVIASMVTKNRLPALAGCVLFAFSVSLNTRDNSEKKKQTPRRGGRQGTAEDLREGQHGRRDAQNF